MHFSKNISRKPQNTQAMRRKIEGYINTYEQLGYTEKQAYNVASVTSGLRSPTKILK